jgi:hypothetical protein
VEKTEGNKKKNGEKQMMRRRKENDRLYEDDPRETGIIRPIILLLVLHFAHFARCLLFLITAAICVICGAFPDILHAHACSEVN